MRAGLIIRWIIGQMRNRGAHNDDDYYLARWRNKGRDSMNMLSKLAIRLTAQKVGQDEFGNSYYQTRKPKRGNRNARYVIYNGDVEASKVPSDWHGWLHYSTDLLPSEAGLSQHQWQQPHLPNLTGTKYAHRPAGHMLKGGKRAPATGDYEPWQP